jgi:hypothetical protein
VLAVGEQPGATDAAEDLARIAAIARPGERPAIEHQAPVIARQLGGRR